MTKRSGAKRHRRKARKGRVNNTPSGYEQKDLASFFAKDGFGDLAHITGPGFALDVLGDFDRGWQDVSLYAETGIDATEPVFECATTDTATLKKGMTLSLPELKAHEDGFGINYEIVRIAAAGVQSTRIFLRAL